jgi:nitroimidazol reductase NimA-like FMN-containing flavoprotein (pyridoxamine 5'-phosphate oxidase superfamily)
MTDIDPTETTNLDGYGNPPLEWSRARELLESNPAGAGTPYFLGTVRPDGRPHSAGIGAVWVDGAVYVVSGPQTRKSRNLEANPACTISASLPGMDVVLEGDAARVTDADTLERVASRYRELDWPARVEGDAFTAPYSAPSAGAPPWNVYRVTVHTAFGVASAEPHGATRWRFDR